MTLRDTPPARLEMELQAAGLVLPEMERQRLLPVWEDNLDRRSRLRAEPFSFDDLTFEGFGRNVSASVRPTPLARAETQPAPTDGDPCDLTLAEQSVLLAAGALSSAELTDAYLRRIERHDVALNAFITVDEVGARRAAVRADCERAAGATRGPLHGIPVAVKDMIAVAGLPLTAGSRLLADNVAAADAEAVARMRAGGAVVLGTNTLQEFGTGPSVPDGPRATGRNPWDLARIPGGSSSGSAVAVAAGLCSAALGTDSAGSVRMPATFTGIVGLKPTRGLVSVKGVLPFCWSLDTVGTLTRGVADAALVLDALTGCQPAPGGFGGSLDASVKGTRLGVLRRGFVDASDVRDDVRTAFEASLDLFRALGATTEDIELPTVAWNDAIYTSLLAEAYFVHAATLRERPEAYSEWLRTQLYAGALVTADDLSRARRLQGRMVREAVAALGHVDAFALPGQAEPAPLFSASLRPALTQPRSRFTRPWNITGLPVLAVPCGFSREGLPLSVHLVGRPFGEALLFQLGCAYQRETDWHRRRPDGAKWVAASGAG